MARSSDDRVLLGAIISEQIALGLSPETRKQILFDLSRVPSHMETNRDTLVILTIGEDSSQYAQLVSQLDIIRRNSDLYDLMQEEVVQTEYPYILSSNSTVYEELRFYQIEPGDHIAEIGAGNGEFSAIVSVIYDSLDLYINDIIPSKTQYVSKKIHRIKSIKPHTKTQVVLGTSSEPNLPDGYF